MTTPLRITFGITTHNEGEELQRLLAQLIPFVEETEDDVVILDDFSDDPLLVELLVEYAKHPKVTVYQRVLNKDFAAQKNYLNRKCTGDFIFQLDADETLDDVLLAQLHSLLETNADVDAFLVPRVNVVHGLTSEDVERWHWTVNELGWNCWPDYQTRLYRRQPQIYWEHAVHEQLVGFDSYVLLPAEEEWAIYHIKTIDKQRSQNELYDSLLGGCHKTTLASYL